MPPKKAAAAKRGRAAADPDAPKAQDPDAPKPAAAKAAGPPPRPKPDEHFSGAAGAQVYQEGNVNWAVMLNQTDIKNNNNKFYVIQLLEHGGKYTTYTRWGRVGERGQDAPATCATLNAAKDVFCSKFKDKTKNKWETVKDDPTSFAAAPGKYTLVEMAAGEEAPAVVTTPGGAPVAVRPSKLHLKVQDVLRIIFDKDMFKAQMAEHKLDANKMPLGKLTKAQVERGYNALTEVHKAIQAKASLSTMQDLTSKFYTAIPHDFGRNVPPVIRTEEDVQSKFELLNILNDIQIAVSMDAAADGGDVAENPLDKQFAELRCGLQYVDPKSDEWKIIDTYTKETQGYRKCQITNVYRVDRPDDKARMKAFAKQGNRALLWHGTNIAVVAAILKSGLRIMPHAGGRVGKGLYFASENGKSAGYVRCDNKVGFMFLCEVVMGNTKEINQDDHRLCKKAVDDMKVDSILARGRQEPDPSKDTTMKGEWGDIRVPQGKPIPQPQWAKSTFSQSEYLVYDEGRVRVKYILQMRFDH